MKNRINNILIGLLWLLAITLGASFWFNTKYGFNIFSLPHWQYLAYMQASNQPVRASFYTSFLIFVIVAVFGLYKLLQPRFRRIVLPIIDRSVQLAQKTQTTPEPIQQPQMEPSTLATTPEPKANVATPNTPRPPRLNIPTVSRTSAPVPYVPLTTKTETKRFNPEQEYADIKQIFTSAGFVYKGAPRIKNIQTSIIAIGTGEILWIGANDISTTDMQTAVDTLRGVFTDTLDDIEININAFIIGGANNDSNDSIMHFATVDDLRTFIDTHQNVPPAADEAENFDAYSGYIGTVIEYLGKI